MKNTYKLSNGTEIPQIAFGTWRLPDSRETVEVIKTAINTGYRHIDTAAKYENETSVGRAVRECGLPREELFVTSKLRNTMRGYDNTKKDFERALNVMGLDYMDMFLIHWPAPAGFYPDWLEINAETWRAMEELYEAGKVRAIGVSNFWPHHLEALMNCSRVRPMVNQLKLHPGLIQREVTDYCQRNQILPEAYSPLGAGRLLCCTALLEMGEKYGKSPAQICLRWCRQHRFIPLPKSSSPLRMKQNLDIFNFEIEPADMVLLDTLASQDNDVKDPDKVNLD